MPIYSPIRRNWTRRHRSSRPCRLLTRLALALLAPLMLCLPSVTRALDSLLSEDAFVDDLPIVLSASRAYRDPLLFEQSPGYHLPVPIPNNVLVFEARDVDSEAITAYEIGCIGRFTAIHDFGRGYSASAGYYYISDIKELESTDVRPDQKRMDVRLARSLSTGGQHDTFALAVQNPCDDQRDTPLENSIERRIYGSIAI